LIRRTIVRWILPLAALIISCHLYVRAAVDLALPRVIPALLERSTATESDLTRTFRDSVLVASLILPPLVLLLYAGISWLGARAAEPKWSFTRVAGVFLFASFFVSAGFVAKALLVLATQEPDPAVNLGFWIPQRTPVRAALLALTNPFLLASIAVTVRSFRQGGMPKERAAIAGSLPWVLGMILFAQSGSGGFVPKAPSATEGWPVLEGRAITLRHPPRFESQGGNLFRALDEFTIRLCAKFAAAPRPLRIDLFPDHQSLERAAGEALPVEVTGSIRGTELLYLELPGRNPAVTEARAFEDAARYVAILQLAPNASGAPRWFVEGLAHAESVPHSPWLDLSYVSALKRHGASLDVLQEPSIYRTPNGPLLARGLLDLLAFRHGGREMTQNLFQDVMNGKSFRDALFERTRLTMSQLESEWQDAAQRILARADSLAGASR
jgi:hypothetical protein